MPSIYCSNCGKANPPGASYCNNCGTSLQPFATQQHHSQGKTVAILTVVLAISASLIGGLIHFNLFTFNFNNLSITPVSTIAPITIPTTNPTHVEACVGKNDYPITDTLSGLSSGFYRIEFYVGTGPEYESWLLASPGVSYKVNSNINGHVWEFPSASCTSTDMMDDAIASHRRRSTHTAVSSSSYVDPGNPLVASNFVRQ